MSDENDQQIDTRDDPVAHAAAKAKNASAKKSVGAAPVAAEPRFPSSGQDATMLWDEVITDGKARGLGADQFQMSVTRELVADRPVKVSLGSIDGSSVHLGGTELQRAITEMWHLNSKMRGNTKYKVVFTQKGTGRILTTGYLTLADQEELQGFGSGPTQSFGGYPPSGFGGYPQTPRFVPVPVPSQAPQQPAQAPATPQAQGQDPAVTSMLGMVQQQLQAAQQREQFLTQQLMAMGNPQAVMELLRMGGLGATPIAPAPTQPQMTPEAVGAAAARAVVEALTAAGVIKPSGQGLGAVAATPQAATVPLTPQQVAEKQLGDLTSTLKTFREFKKLFGEISEETSEGLGAAPLEEEADKLAQTKPEDLLPWQRVSLGNWEWAVDKETGDTSWNGVLAGITNKFMNDPAARDQLFGFLGRVTTVVEKLAAGKGAPGAPVPQLTQPPPMLQGNQPTNGAGPGPGGWGGV